MKWRTVVLLALVVLATGCQGLFHKKSPQPVKTEVVQPAAEDVPQPTEVVKVVTVVKKVPVPVMEKKDLTCRVLPPPKPLPLPVAPNIKRGEVLTDKQRIALMQDYIRSLQTYIKNQHETDDKTYQDYIQGCADPVAQPANAATSG